MKIFKFSTQRHTTCKKKISFSNLNFPQKFQIGKWLGGGSYMATLYAIEKIDNKYVRGNL